MIDLIRMERSTLSTEPYEWAYVGELFAPHEAAMLATSFPRDHFKTVVGYDGEKGYEYEARALIAMGANAPSHAEDLSPAWRRLAECLLLPDYRGAVSRLSGRDLSSLTMEVNVFHYGPGAWLGPHLDLREKIVTHVFYFNEGWNKEDGGCLNILRSPDLSDVAACVEPVVGNSALLVRSEKSWHAVSPVVRGCHVSRRSMVITFYSPGSISTMWPPGDAARLHTYDGKGGDHVARDVRGAWTMLRGKVSSWVNPGKARR